MQFLIESGVKVLGEEISSLLESCLGHLGRPTVLCLSDISPHGSQFPCGQPYYHSRGDKHTKQHQEQRRTKEESSFL